jgi:hypothetical protein
LGALAQAQRDSKLQTFYWFWLSDIILLYFFS